MTPRSLLPTRVLIPVANPATADELLRIGTSLIERDGELTALGIIEVPEGMPLSDGATRARQTRRLLQRALDQAPQGPLVHPIVRIGRHAPEGIVEAAAEQDADLIIFGWGGRANAHGNSHGEGDKGSAATAARPARPVSGFSATIEAVTREAPCDIAVVKHRGTQAIRRVLVPVRGGPHAELAIRFGDEIARRNDARLVVMHVVPPDLTDSVREQAEHALASFVRLHAHGNVEPVLRESLSVRNAILREADGADIVVMGASMVPESTSTESYLFGALAEAVATHAKPTVIVVKTRETLTHTGFEQLGGRPDTLAAADRAIEESRAIPTQVERWLSDSTYHHAGFADLERLVALKQRQDLSISLVLPAFNAEEWIGKVVARAKRDLMERNPLVDEILVIDAGSDDRTPSVAAEAGARVVEVTGILPQYGTYAGRGEALWKALFETSGDIIAWVDADGGEWHPRMVYGTVGPLLEESRLQYVKGFDEKPVVKGGVTREGSGGRVAKLVARPLVNLFFPELSGFVQPLAGELAARRSLLETLPFFTGGAVEIGHLVDIADRLGLEALAQVDLEREDRRGQDAEALSKSSFSVAQALMKRLEDRRKVRLFAELGSTAKLPTADGDGLVLEVLELADHERPPMLRIPEYLERHSRLSASTAAAPSGVDPSSLADDDDEAGRRSKSKAKRKSKSKAHARAVAEAEAETAEVVERDIPA